ncbi:MAG TPA: type I DNA topoisomerase [Aggregatilineales bacterium]|nr:type I DNA topoisomerase [Aggregatilineales bacterium]
MSKTKSTRSPGRSGKLVIVESPAKARTVGRFLGKGYTVKASIGHVRDLLRSRLSVDIENDFDPTYRVPNEKREVVKEIKTAAQKSKEVYLATDPDREGEAIAWHLIHAADIDPESVQRVVFHEITDTAIHEAFAHTRQLDMQLVNAQQARRILDRLVGYNLTELLWDRVRNRLSAGRVQSVAVRLVVDREKEIEAFVQQEYWTLDAELAKQQNLKERFRARLVRLNGEDVTLGSEAAVQPHLEILERSEYKVSEIKRGTRQRRPSAPFTTSTLQQEASRALNFSSGKTMSIAQQLYEGIDLASDSSGLITYMRTDSTNVAVEAQKAARNYITAEYGAEYLPETTPQYKTRSKGAQEAHEAIRPTNVYRTPDSVKSHLSRDQYRLYTLIWKRFVASQMAGAVYDTIRVDILAGDPKEGTTPYLFRASGSTIRFKGFLAVYEETRDEDSSEESDIGLTFPEMSVDEMLALIKLIPEQHFTQPPPRFTEATLVKELEEKGIGRPSTYAPTVAVIQNRDYVRREDKRLHPTETGVLVNDLLVEYFPEVLNYDFTATMEDRLDSIAEGELEWVPVLKDFYGEFTEHLKHAYAHMPSMMQEEKIGRTCPECGEGELVMRYGKWGKFIGCERYPECSHTEPWLEYIGVKCPVCEDGEVIELRTRRGRVFYGCTNYNKDEPEAGCQFTSWKRPLKSRCPACNVGTLILRNKNEAECLNCRTVHKMETLPDEQEVSEPA